MNCKINQYYDEKSIRFDFDDDTHFLLDKQELSVLSKYCNTVDFQKAIENKIVAMHKELKGGKIKIFNNHFFESFIYIDVEKVLSILAGD